MDEPAPDGEKGDAVRAHPYRQRGPHTDEGTAALRAINQRLERLDNHQSKEKSTATKTMALFILKLAFVGAFSLGSWYVWDTGFQRYAGRCLGPVCVHVDAGSTNIGVKQQ